MIPFSNVEIDLEAGAGYVTYREIPAGTRVAKNLRLTETIVVDLDRADEVLGIELLAFDDSTVARARDFAHERGLAFPAAFAGVLTPG